MQKKEKISTVRFGLDRKKSTLKSKKLILYANNVSESILSEQAQ
jgi:hypothetical protein